jgi:hypothetical protein
MVNEVHPTCPPHLKKTGRVWKPDLQGILVLVPRKMLQSGRDSAR